MSHRLRVLPLCGVGLSQIAPESGGVGRLCDGLLEMGKALAAPAGAAERHAKIGRRAGERRIERNESVGD